MGKQGVWVVIFQMNEDGKENISFQFTSNTDFFTCLNPITASCLFNSTMPPTKTNAAAPVKTTTIPPPK